MPITLEGGCRVTEMREGAPLETGTLRIWPQVGRGTGARAISLRVLEFAQGISPGIRNDECDEILYVLGNEDEPESSSSEKPLAKLLIEGQAYEVGAATGIYLEPGQTLAVDNPAAAPLVMISSRCPEPPSTGLAAAVLTSPTSSSSLPAKTPMVRLADRPALPTADRWYRVLVDDEIGSMQVTQFVGSIPPGRAPDHFHKYEEVLFILRGQGRMWAGETHTPIGRGSCIFLPQGQVHCVENTGAAELRVLGVFYPAGSPSVRYEVD